MTVTIDREEFAPNWSVHPGAVLEERLEVFGLSQAEFARRAGLTAKLVSDIIAGKNIVSSSTAHAIAPVTGLPAIVWLNLQSAHSLFEEQARSRPTEAAAQKFLARFPVRDLQSRKMLPNKSGVDLIDDVLRFLGIGSLSAYSARRAGLVVNYRHSQTFPSSEDHLFAWLQCGVVRARQMRLSAYDKVGFEKAARRELRALTVKRPDDFWADLVEKCRTLGVAIVAEPPFPGTKLSGAAHWLDEGNPVIQLSLRHKTNDHFWWSFFHECGHVILHPEQNFVDDATPRGSEREDEANEFALEALVGKKRLEQFIATGRRSRAAILAFANEVGVHPGSVVGMLQFREAITWGQHNDLKESFRFSV